jgi:hypothetical protein
MNVEDLKPGQTVYTVNAKTNTVDSWEYSGKLKTREGVQLLLTNGKKRTFLPARCVFKTELEAKFIAGSYQ